MVMKQGDDFRKTGRKLVYFMGLLGWEVGIHTLLLVIFIIFFFFVILHSFHFFNMYSCSQFEFHIVRFISFGVISVVNFRPLNAKSTM